MNILIINAHWNNRGDEAAIRAMIDELMIAKPEAKIAIQIVAAQVDQFPYNESKVKLITLFPTRNNLFELPFLLLSKGKFCFSKNAKEFCKCLEKADIVIHAPGGPSIGDIYTKGEFCYIIRLLVAIFFKKPIFFYAPSMGPFNKLLRNKVRRYILNKAKFIAVRESVSKSFLDTLNIKQNVVVTLDSAIQHDIDNLYYEKLLNEYKELKSFLENHKKVIGLTVTDLQWNSKYVGNSNIKDNIRLSFENFIEYLIEKDYKILFIPQLFGEQNDYKYMFSFKRKELEKSVFVLPDTYDCYFQQFIISKLKAVVGMRYHSNIFSAKMKIPFISVSYEHKMSGFMDKAGLNSYCIDVNDLSFDRLKNTFERLDNEYETYKDSLKELHYAIKEESAQTTKYLLKVIDELDHR